MNLTSISSPLNGVDYNSILTPHTRSGKREISPISCPPGLLPAHWDALRTTGSGWDVAPPCPDAPLPRHLTEWVEGSAVAPELAAANVVSLRGAPVLEALAGDRLARMGGHAGQYVTRAVAKILRPLETIAEAGGWWCSGLDPKGDWRAPMEWGQFKPDAPRWDQEKDRPRKYEHPSGAPAHTFWLRVPAVVARLTADRFGLALPTEAAADTSGEAGAYWRWWASEGRLPLVIIEGPKKAAALRSIGIPTVAVPGIWPGQTTLAELLALPLKDRPVWVLFDDSSRENPDEPKAADRLGRELAKAGAKPLVGIVPGTRGKGADDHLAAGGSWEELAAALAPPGPRPVLPHLRAADRIAPPGVFLGVACPIPSPEAAALVILQAAMGSGKTRAVEDALHPRQLEGVPILLPSHRRNLGQALTGRVGIPWEATPGTDERLQGVSGCLDSWCPDSRLQITGETGSGGVLVLDELMQLLEHLLLGSGTALTDRTAPRRAAVLRTFAEQLPRARQVIAADGQMAQWGVDVLEALTGRRAVVIASGHQPMAGRPLYCPAGFTTPTKAAEAFRAHLDQTIRALGAGDSLMVWCSAQKGEESLQAPANLADRHRRHRPADLVDVIDSSTPDLAADLAADPDGFAARRIAEATAQGGSWVLFCSPAISSGISFERWKPAAVIAYSGGLIAPEHAAQALARVRCPEVPAWLFAPERSPGKGLRVGSGATDAAALISDLRNTTDPLLGALRESGAEEALLKAWGELGAIRNRQTFAYRATAAGLLEREGWELQAPGSDPCPALVDSITAELRAIRDGKREAKRQAILTAEPLTAPEAAKLERRRTLEPSEAAALERYRLANRWALGGGLPSLELLDADREGLADRLRWGWILSTPEALALVPHHDWLSIARLDACGRPFAPDRLRETLAPKVAALQALGLPRLLERFAGGELISAADPALVALHTTATACRRELAAAVGVSPGKLPSGTLRNLLRAIGWKLQRGGRIHTRGDDRGVCTYSAAPIALPEGVSGEALAAQWLGELREGGAKNHPIENLYRVKKCATTPPHPSPPLLKRWPLAPAVAVPWPSGPPRTRTRGFAAAC